MPRYKSKVAVYLVLFRDTYEKSVLTLREILLHLRNVKSDFHPNEYSLPAGHVEEGESVSAALFRESLEEINVIPFNPAMFHVSYRKENGYTAVDFFFIANRYSREINNNEPDKCAELKWCDINKLPPNTAPYIAKAIENLKAGNMFGEYGW